MTLEQVSGRAAELDLRAAVRRLCRLLLTCLAAALFAAGWLARQMVAATAAAVLWAAAAVALGWSAAQSSGPRAG